MEEVSNALLDIAEYLPRIMRKLFGGGLIISALWELTIPQLRALNIVANRPGCTMGALAEGLGVQLNAATGLASRLVQRGLLERSVDPEDRRLVRLHLSESGRRAREACQHEMRQRVKEALQHLSAGEQDRIATALLSLHGALEAAEAGACQQGVKER